MPVATEQHRNCHYCGRPVIVKKFDYVRKARPRVFCDRECFCAYRKRLKESEVENA
jgi:hypothetical protein